ncbi:MAG TPA: response regulator, partial [Deltaproteobacteria bacterium]|nr:response regulator [Deltaproteobacteria bacterium]
GRLTGGISHDFNNILQAVMSYQQLLTMNKTSADPDWHFLAQIGDLTKRATDLVGRLLVFSRKVESSLEPLDMNHEINTIYELLRGTLPKNIVLTLDPSGGPCIIHGDRGQLGQVIMNLAVNARDAMPDGGELKIRSDTVMFEQDRYYRNVRMHAGEQVLLTISDTGQGIERKNLDHIFEPYFTTKEADKGTGIGLSVVYGIIKNHGGFIFCDSEPGRGTTFEICLPRAEEEDVVDAVEDKGDKKTSPRGHETILLVDDEPSLIETGRELFSLLGYSVLTAESGESALAIIERERDDINLVVLDLMMPGMSGEQCLAEIKKIAPAMKVVAVSGYSGATVREDIIRKGAVDFFQKPYLVETLSARIREILDHSGRSS